MDAVLIILIAIASILSAFATLIGIGYSKKLRENPSPVLEKYVQAIVGWVYSYTNPVKTEEKLVKKKMKSFAELKKALDELDDETIKEKRDEYEKEGKVIIEPIHEIKDDYKEE